jgi:hypothetical protein
MPPIFPKAPRLDRRCPSNIVTIALPEREERVAVRSGGTPGPEGEMEMIGFGSHIGRIGVGVVVWRVQRLAHLILRIRIRRGRRLYGG